MRQGGWQPAVAHTPCSRVRRETQAQAHTLELGTGGHSGQWASLIKERRDWLSVQSLSHVQTLCDPMHCSTPGLPVHHQLLEFTQTHAR